MAVRSRKKKPSNAAEIDELSKKSEKVANAIADTTYGSKTPSDEPKNRDEPKKRLGIDIPVSDYKAFFVKAKMDDTDMSTLVRGWIKEYIS
jgi:hypothetical protein